MVDAGAGSLMQTTGLWIGFVVSLSIFSLIIRDNALSRLTLHLVVGTALGYAALIAWQEVLYPRLLAPLTTDSVANRHLLWPLALGLLLAVSGLERIFRPDRPTGPTARWRQWIGLLGILPVSLVVGLTIAIIMLGSILGTLAPLTLRTAATGLVWSDGLVGLLTGILTILITTGTLLHVRIKPARDLKNQPKWLQRFLSVWIDFGKYGIWLAAGMIFARLMASRFSLLIARFSALAAPLQQSGLFEWIR